MALLYVCYLEYSTSVTFLYSGKLSGSKKILLIKNFFLCFFFVQHRKISGSKYLLKKGTAKNLQFSQRSMTFFEDQLVPAAFSSLVCDDRANKGATAQYPYSLETLLLL